MAPTEMQSLSFSGSHPKSVAALFGDEGDSQPLWFKKDAFGDKSFDPDAYIADLRRFVALDNLRTELRSHQAVLKHELVELINRDYTDFVNLSTKLVDVDGAVLRMRMPLNELRGKLITVRASVSDSLAFLEDGLKRRAEASASREILELLLDTSHVVSKVEKLLVELQNMPEDDGNASNHAKSGLQNGGSLGEQTDHGASLEESRSRLLERIASEMNRLKFYVARAQDLPFIQNMEKRIQHADASLNASLCRSFEGGLGRRDEMVIYHCLRAYSAIDNTAGAEEAFRSAVVSPFVQRIVPSNAERRVVGGNGALSEIFEEVERHIQTECKFLLDISAAANSGLHIFDFLSNSILKEVHSAIQKGKPGAFSPGKPTEFLANYKASLKFLNFLEGYCQSQAAIESFRSQGAYVDFIKQWNLGVYYTLRFQEIAGALDTALSAPISTLGQDSTTNEEDGSLGLALQTSAVLWDCLQRCWQEDVLIKAVSDKFLKLTLQLLSRYSTWLSTGLSARRSMNSERTGGEWALAATPEDFLLVSHDAKLIVFKIKNSYVQHVLDVLKPSPGEVLHVVQQSIVHGSDMLLEIVPALMDILTETLADKCVEVLKQAKGITATYRMTNKPLPTRHSPYVSSVLQPLKAFLEGERIIYLSNDAQRDVLATVVEKITARYDEQAREIINAARKTETTLQRLRQGAAARQRGAGTDMSDNSISDTDKICAQLFLDIQEFGRRLSALGLIPADLPAYVSLWQSVAPQDRQSVITL